MSIQIGPAKLTEQKPRIVVIGVGGAGGNAVANMIETQVEGVDFVVANTDAQAIVSTLAEGRIQLGPETTSGLGAGGRPEVGRAAAEESIASVEELLDGAHMCFIASGMGGGTGTGAAPVIAEAARRKGVLTVGVVTKPFLFEGSRRMRSAEAGIEELQKHVDTLIVIPNQNLFLVAKSDTTFKEAFLLADEVLQQGVRSITDLIVNPGFINLDFADIRSVMGEGGKAMMGTGEAEGEDRALAAAEKAIANPLLDGVSMQGAKGVIISIIGGDDIKLMEVDEAANHIRDLVDPDANIIWGSAFDPRLDGKIRVSVVATGIDSTADFHPSPRSFSAAKPSVSGSSSASFSGGSGGGSSPAASDKSDAPAASGSGSSASSQSGSGSPAQSSSADVGNADAKAEASKSKDDGKSSEGASASKGEFNPPAGTEIKSSASDDELVLDAGRIVPERGDASGSTNASGSASANAEGSSAAPTPDVGTALKMGKAKGDDKPAPRIASGGGTLFERMSNLSRGQSRGASDDKKQDDVDDQDSAPALNIPRFLGRQSNQ